MGYGLLGWLSLLIFGCRLITSIICLLLLRLKLIEKIVFRVSVGAFMHHIKRVNHIMLGVTVLQVSLLCLVILLSVDNFHLVYFVIYYEFIL